MPEDEQTKIHERLRHAREQAGLSQGQVAKLMGYHRPTISEIEAGRRKISSTELSKFAELYDVTVVWLLNEADEHNAVVELAARELAKLKKDDLDRVLRLLKSLRQDKD